MKFGRLWIRQKGVREMFRISRWPNKLICPDYRGVLGKKLWCVLHASCHFSWFPRRVFFFISNEAGGGDLEKMVVLRSEQV